MVFVCGRPVKEFEFPMMFNNDKENFNYFHDFELDPLFKTDGSISGMMITANDVTEKVEAKKKVSRAEEMLRLAVEASEMAIWEIYLNTDKINYYNRWLDI